MRPYLHPCSACSRHILSSEPECPFCGSVPAAASPPKQQKVRGRLSRAALVALGTTLAATPTVACGGDPDNLGGDGDGDGDMSGDGDGDMAGDGDNSTPIYGISPAGGGGFTGTAAGGGSATGGATLVGVGGDTGSATGGTMNEGGMGGAVDGSGGADEMGSGGDQLIPVYGNAPRPLR